MGKSIFKLLNKNNHNYKERENICISYSTHNHEEYAFDITNVWINDKKDYIIVTDNKDYVISNGKKYENGVNGTKLKFDPDEGTKEVLNWWKELKGGKLVFNSKIDYPQGLPSADLEIDGIQVEVKNPKGNSRWTISNQFKTKNQAETYVIDISNMKISDNEVIERTYEVFMFEDRNWINTIIIKRNENVVVVYQRLKLCNRELNEKK